jgi:hypothetical protein
MKGLWLYHEILATLLDAMGDRRLCYEALRHSQEGYGYAMVVIDGSIALWRS